MHDHDAQEQMAKQIDELKETLDLAARVLDDALTWGFIDNDMVDAAQRCIKDAQRLTGKHRLNG
jgi:hypothetical protein